MNRFGDVGAGKMIGAVRAVAAVVPAVPVVRDGAYGAKPKTVCTI